MNCNSGSVHAWDEGVCFYTSSVEKTDGLMNDEKLHYKLAEKQYENFKTCCVKETDLTGTAKFNYDLFSLFSMGNYQIWSGNCLAVRVKTKKIVTEMYSST